MLPNSEKDFLKRHIGPSKEDQSKMLKELNYQSIDDLMNSVMPKNIWRHDKMALPPALSEHEILAELRSLADKNQRTCGRGYVSASLS